MQVFGLKVTFRGEKYPGIVNVSAGSPKNLVDFWGALAHLPSIPLPLPLTYSRFAASSNLPAINYGRYTIDTR